MPMDKNDILQGLSMTYGIEKAEKLLDDFINSVGLKNKKEYTKDEIIKISEFMRSSEDRFIKIIGTALRTQAVFIKD